MPVYQDFGPGIGAGISAGVQGFVAGRQKKRADEQFQQELEDHARLKRIQDIQLGQQGIHLLAPGELPPVKAMANDLTDRLPTPRTTDDFMPQFDPNGGAPTTKAATMSRAGAGAGNIPGRPMGSAASAPGASPGAPSGAPPSGASSFQNVLAGLMTGGPQGRQGPQGPQASRGPRYEFGSGYYLDHQPQWDAADAARAEKTQDQFTPLLVSEFMKQGERARKIAGYTAAGVPADRAALYVDNPALADNDPTIGKPQTRSLEHIDAGNRIEVRDALSGTLVNTIPKGIAPVSPEVQAIRDATVGTRKDALSQRNEARLVSQYTEATKKYSQTADALQAINENRAGALKGDPIAQQTLLQDFIKLNLPGQQVTEGELGHYMHLMGLGEKGQQMLDRLRQGTPLGAEQIKLILSHADNLAKERRGAHQYLRQQYVDRGARTGVPAESFPDWFGFLPPSEGSGGRSGSGGSGRDPGGPLDFRGDTSVSPFAALIPKKP